MGNSGNWFFEMFDALPREGEHWHYELVEWYQASGGDVTQGHFRDWRFRVNGDCLTAGVNLGPGAPHAPTRNLAVAAALSEARHEENDDAKD